MSHLNAVLPRSMRGFGSTLCDKKAAGLVVASFPANEFGAQEPASNREIANLCSARFGVIFPLFEKHSGTGRTLVGGLNRRPIVRRLTNKHGGDNKDDWSIASPAHSVTQPLGASDVPKRVDSSKSARDVRGILKGYVDRSLSRRHFLAALTAIGISASGAEAVAQEFEPFVSRDGADPQALPAWVQVTKGTGGQLLVKQLLASGHKYVFINPSSSEAPIFDALVDSPE